MENTILFIGNTGVGKSFVCNKIFESYGSPSRFKSDSGNISVTGAIQQGSITFKGKTFTIIDTPGFFDVSASDKDPRQKDGENVCKLVKALEGCKEIYGIEFIYTDRFTLPHKHWYDRIIQIISKGYQGHVILLHNKQQEMTEVQVMRNQMEIQGILGNAESEIKYSPFQILRDEDDPREQVNYLMSIISQFVPFKLIGLQVPDICYESTVEDPEYEQEVASVKKDDGRMVVTTKDKSGYTEEQVRSGKPLKKLFGGKDKLKKFVPRMVNEDEWVKREVTYRTVAVLQKIYKVRFDGTRDFVALKEIRRREEQF